MGKNNQTRKQYHITFKNIEHGEVTLTSEINQVTKDWMYWTDICHAMYYGTKRDITRMVRHLRKTTETQNDSFDFIK